LIDTPSYPPVLNIQRPAVFRTSKLFTIDGLPEKKLYQLFVKDNDAEEGGMCASVITTLEEGKWKIIWCFPSNYMSFLQSFKNEKPAIDFIIQPNGEFVKP
jgi:hypothetical protein